MRRDAQKTLKYSRVLSGLQSCRAGSCRSIPGAYEAWSTAWGSLAEQSRNSLQTVTTSLPALPSQPDLFSKHVCLCPPHRPQPHLLQVRVPACTPSATSALVASH